MRVDTADALRDRSYSLSNGGRDSIYISPFGRPWTVQNSPPRGFAYLSPLSSLVAVLCIVTVLRDPFSVALR